MGVSELFIIRYTIHTMSFSLFFFDYSRWHYREGPTAIFHIWFTFFRYVEQTFAIRLHARSLFSPWHRVQETTEHKFDIEEWAANTLVNVISRLLGFFLRSVIILTGLVFGLLLCIALPLVLLLWFIAPLFITGLILSGLTLIFISYGYTI